MRPSWGVILELVLLCLAVIVLMWRFPEPFFAIEILFVQVVIGFLIHCPAHYVVGTILGIRFNKLAVGGTSLSKALPPPMGGIMSLFPVAHLQVDKASLQAAGPVRSRAMFLSGVTASVISVLFIALFALLFTDSLSAGFSVVYAIVYSLSDIVLSPKTGDIMRARRAKQ